VVIDHVPHEDPLTNQIARSESSLKIQVRTITGVRSKDGEKYISMRVFVVPVPGFEYPRKESRYWQDEGGFYT
jgi:hypothetical protein